MSAQTPAHVSITSEKEQMNYHSHQSVFISQDGCQCRRSPAVPLLSCHFFPLSPPFSLCPFVISLSLVLAHSLTLSIPLLSFISHHVLYPLFLHYSLHLSCLLVRSEAPWSTRANSQSQALRSCLTNRFVFPFSVNSAFRDTEPRAEGGRGKMHENTWNVQRELNRSTVLAHGLGVCEYTEPGATCRTSKEDTECIRQYTTRTKEVNVNKDLIQLSDYKIMSTKDVK